MSFQKAFNLKILNLKDLFLFWCLLLSSLTYTKRIHIVIFAYERCFSIVPIIVLIWWLFQDSRGRIDFGANRNALTYQRCSCARVEVSRKVFFSAKAARDPFARTSGGTTSYVLLFFHLPLVRSDSLRLATMRVHLSLLNSLWTGSLNPL